MSGVAVRRLPGLRLDGVARVAFVALVFLFLFAPLAIVVLFSFNSSPGLAFPITGLSLRWYEKALTDPLVTAAIWRSVVAAGGTAIGAGVLGTLAALTIFTLPGRLRTAIQAFTLLPLVTPGLLLAIGLAIYFNRLGLNPPRLPMTIAGHVLVALPFVLLIMTAALARFPYSLLEAARDLGAPPVRIFFTITLPLMLPSLLGAMLLAAAVSLDEFIIAFFTSGNDATLPLIIYTRIRRSIDPSLNALSTLMLMSTAVVALIAARATGGNR